MQRQNGISIDLSSTECVPRRSGQTPISCNECISCSAVFHQLQTGIKKLPLGEDSVKNPVELTQQLYVVFPSAVLDSAESFRGVQNALSFASCPVLQSARIHIDPALSVRIRDASGEEGPTQTASFPQNSSQHEQIWELNPFGVYSLELFARNEDDMETTERSIDGRFFDGEAFLIDNRDDGGTFVLELSRHHLSTNTVSTHDVSSVCLLQSFPWAIRVWMHTLQVWKDNQVRQQFLNVVCPSIASLYIRS